MTTTIHPWTMYEVARFRDEERLLRSEAAMRALKPHAARPADQASAISQGTSSRLDRIRHQPSLSNWVHMRHLRPHDRHV